MANRDPDHFRSELEAAQERAARAEKELEATKREVEDLRDELREAVYAPARRPSRAPWVVLYVAALAAGAGLHVASARRQASVEEPAAPPVASAEKPSVFGTGLAKSPLAFEERRRLPDATGIVGVSGGIIGKDGVVRLPPDRRLTMGVYEALVEERTPVKDVLAATYVDTPSQRFHVVVGSRGAAAVRREDKWTVEQTGVDSTLLAVAARADGQVFAVGEHGTIVHRDPAVGWSSDSSHVSETLRAVAVSSAEVVVAAGDDGVLLVRGAGGDWVRRRTPTVEALRVLLPTSDGAFFVAGDRGTLLVYDDDGGISVLHPPVTDDFVAAAPFLRRLVLATRNGKVVTYEAPLREWSVAEVAPGEEVVGFTTVFLDALLVTSSGRTFVGRLAPE